jgi:hypothetical protein
MGAKEGFLNLRLCPQHFAAHKKKASLTFFLYA